jgi:hypothetical protein
MKFTLASRRLAAGIFLAMTAALGSLHAAIPTPEKLLPDDTLLVVTIPDYAKFQEICLASPQTQLWKDPAMKPFRDHFMSKLKEELLEPLERDLGVKFDDYTSLPQGQLTFAITQNGWTTIDGQTPGMLLLLDAKGHSDQLKTNLATLKRKWLDSGKSIRTEKIRDIDFSILPLADDDVPASLKKFLSPSANDEGEDDSTNSTPGTELVFGQFESLLIVGNSTKAVEKVAVHLTGGSMPSLGDLAAFESVRVALFRDAPMYAWVDVKTYLDAMLKDTQTESSPFASVFDMSKVISATGLGGLRTAAFTVHVFNEGTSFQFSLGVPESARQGLFKLFPASGKEASPPAFVPADVVKFQRIRIDGQKAWATFQSMLNEIFPQMVGSLNFVLDTANDAAKQKDPNFDLRKNIFGNLGDDVIAYEKAPKGTSFAELQSAPSLLLIGSPNAEQFASSFKAILALSNAQDSTPKERDFLGRKIYSVPAPTLPSSASGKSTNTLYYTASGSYVAFTSDVGLLEEYLRSGNSEQKQLRDSAGFSDAVAKVGGGSTGWLAYENVSETTRATIEALRKKASEPEKTEMLAPGIPAFVPENPLKDWVDFSLLPPFEKIAKYFSFTVYAGVATPEALNFNFFSPVPADLRK